MTAVIFSSQRTPGDGGYGATADRMEELARRSTDGFGITVSYWRDDESARAWKQVVEHLDAQRRGREEWYESYTVRVAHVERSYSFTHSP